ncbi:MAG: SIMPL domain-containing protein [Bacteroidales bacterium]|nr:SIMPL domain-containing protein [Bacteroidales bacterium]MBD5246374.1 SIMPL domain-containing protein [Barnesiella sp.]MDE6081245.1 SIMPL domain-containing protein [Muribaculaceae bacterium]
MTKFKLIIASVILALGLLGLGLSIRSGINSISRQSRMVSVRGLAEREVKANKVTWPIVYKLVGNDLSTVYNEIQSSNNSVLKYLKDNGVQESQISINAPEIIDLSADRYNTQKVPFRYNVTSVIVVVSEDVDRIRQLITNQGELLKEGIVVTDGGYQYQVQYDFTELNNIKPEMIAEATANAREAGNRFAKDSESTLGKIKNADQGQFTISDRDPNTPYIKRIRVVTRIDFYLED